MGTVLGYLRPYCRRVAAGVSLKFAAAVLELLIPLLLERIVVFYVPAEDLPGIWRCGGLMALLALGAVLSNITANRMAAWVSMEVTRTLRRDVYDRAQRLSCAQVDRLGESSLVSRLTNDTYNVHQMFDKVQRGGVRAPMLVLGGLVLTFLLEPALAAVQLAVSLLTLLTIWQVTRRGIPRYAQAQSAADTMVRVLRENASGVRVIKALACQNRERERFEEANGAVYARERAAGTVMAAANPLTDLILNSGLVLVVAVGAFRVQAGAMDAGRIVTFLSYFALIQNATLGIAKIFLRISKGAASAKRLEEVLLSPEDQPIRPPRGTKPETELGMEEVSFSYLGVERDLDRISFSLKKGEALGILGPIGSGKTTLIALLLRQYDAGEGLVFVGGRDVESLDRRELQSFGPVFQNEALISGTVYENISFLRHLPREDVIAAAKTAQAWDFIQALPEGLDTQVDIQGANLSGGQRQRLLIARALAGKPSILVLDSADSALDYRTAAALRQALRRDCAGLTTVTISARVASLREADRILVLEEGHVAAQGSHEELMASCGRYRRAAELQRGEAMG